MYSSILTRHLSHKIGLKCTLYKKQYVYPLISAHTVHLASLMPIVTLY